MAFNPPGNKVVKFGFIAVVSRKSLLSFVCR